MTAASNRSGFVSHVFHRTKGNKMLTTWTLILVYCFSCPVGKVVVVPNFQTLEACAAYKDHLMTKQPLLKGSQIIECVPSDYTEN